MPDSFFLEQVYPESGKKVILEEGEHRHFANSLRGAVGDTVRLINGQGGWALAACTEVKRNYSVFEISENGQIEKPAMRMILAFAPPKGKKLATLIKVVTELGVGGLWPVVYKHSVRYGGKNIVYDIRRYAIEALKQSGRLFLPEIMPERTLDETVGDIAGEQIYIGSRDGKNACEVLPPPAVPVVFIGPEGGILPEEFDRLNDAGAIPVSLGENILRIETACAAAVAVFSNLGQPA